MTSRTQSPNYFLTFCVYTLVAFAGLKTYKYMYGTPNYYSNFNVTQYLDHSDPHTLRLHPHNLFELYTQVHNKTYSEDEYQQRLKNFVLNYHRIRRHNSNPNRTWEAGWTSLTDLSPMEYRHMLGTRVPPASHPSRNQHELPWFQHLGSRRSVHKFSNTTLPESVDWRADGLVTDIKNQGQCGSCWAFSAVGAMEGQHAKVTGKLVSLSEQNLVDCVTTNYGCGGGWMSYAMEYVVQNHGIDTESSYPYKAVDEQCVFNRSDVGATFYQVVNITRNDTQGLLDAVANIGPISVAICADDNLQNYVSGLYSSSECDPNYLNHGVLVVGYGKTREGKPYYIIKNSWGTTWGENGYVYWDRTDPNMCGVAEVASYPLARNSV